MANFAYYNISTATYHTVSALDQPQLKSITLCNKDASGDACQVGLFIKSEYGTDITSTGTLSNELVSNVATSNSVTLTVDGTAATTATFENEKVYKSDGTLFGTCTARNSNTEIVFGGGLSSTIANNDTLYTGSRYSILNDVTIPHGYTLVLESPEIDYDVTLYSLVFYLKSVSASQLVDIKITY
jgi:hypothetical protein